MKTRINLYVEQLQPIKEKLPLAMSLSIIGVVLTLTLLASGALYWLNQQELATQQQLQASLSSEQQHLAARALTLSKINNNQLILDKISQAKGKIKNKKRILAALNKHMSSPPEFSKLLLALAKLSDRKVWLTQIKSQAGALTLLGGAGKSIDIPRWVERLNLAPQLQGKTFSALAMERDDKIVNFSLSNRNSADMAKGIQ